MGILSIIFLSKRKKEEEKEIKKKKKETTRERRKREGSPSIYRQVYIHPKILFPVVKKERKKEDVRGPKKEGN